MNVRTRWWLACALMCATAVCAQRARATETPTTAPAALRLEPLILTRPLAPETIGRLLDEAEALYRSRRLIEARDAYTALVGFDPGNVHAWLRLGNVHQQMGRDAQALDAYRQASHSIPETAADAASRGKALLNIALLNVALASRAIDELDAMNAASLKPQRDAVGRRIGTERRRAGTAAGRQAVLDDESPVPAARGVERSPPDPAAASVPRYVGAVAPDPRVPARSERGATSPAAPGVSTGPDPAFEPYTVDRWVAKPRRSAVRADTGRSAVTAPITETPLPEPPRVEVFRGAPASGARP
jgi:hypothetical protein